MRTAAQPLLIAGLGPSVVTTDAVTATDAQACLFARAGANDNAPRTALVLLRRLCAARAAGAR